MYIVYNVQTPRAIRVSLGDHSWTDRQFKFVTVSRIVLHPDFVMTDTYMGWDYAVLTLTRPVHLSHKVQPICLPASRGTGDYSGQLGTITGWGIQVSCHSCHASCHTSCSFAGTPSSSRFTIISF